jgi:hypothetical protein
VCRRPGNCILRRVGSMQDKSTAKGKGRQKKMIVETIKNDLEANDLVIDMIFNRIL